MQPVESSPPPLPPDYYVHNFLLVLRTVLERDPHLFYPEELALFAQLEALPTDALRLYIRLFNRTGPWFRLEKLQYAEIADLPRTARELSAAGFLRVQDSSVPPPGSQSPADAAEELTLDALLSLYTVPELTLVAKSHGLKASGRPAVLAVLNTLPPDSLWPQLLSTGPVIRLKHVGLLERVQRLFFLNGMQDATTLVTADLALFQYPSYRIWRSRPVFADRRELDAWLEAEALQNAWHQARATLPFEQARALGEAAVEAFLNLPPGPPDFLSRFSARTVHARTALAFAADAEGALGREEAARLYTRLLDAGLPARYRGEAFCRLALHWERTGWLEASLATCKAGLDENTTRRGERLELEKRRERLEQRLARQNSPQTKTKKSPRATSPLPGEELPSSPRLTPREVTVQRPLLLSGLYQRIQFAGAAGEALGVEAVALEAYRSAGCEGMYTENLFFTTLCGILCWDIFFAELPDVFQSAYQDAPLDLNTDHFYEQRRPLIQARIDTLRSGDLSLLTHHHATHYGRMARGVAWDAFPLPVLEAVAQRLGGQRIALILEHLLEDYRLRRRGFPDLLLWKDAEAPSPDTSAPPDTPANAVSPATAQALFWGEKGYHPPGEVWFAEVKSPRDRVSPEQKAWMDALCAMGIPVEVCWVQEVP